MTASQYSYWKKDFYNFKIKQLLNSLIKVHLDQQLPHYGHMRLQIDVFISLLKGKEQ